MLCKSYTKSLNCSKTDSQISERNCIYWPELQEVCGWKPNWLLQCWLGGKFGWPQLPFRKRAFLANWAVSWLSKKQALVALLTTEAEYVALSMATQEALWLRRLLTDVGKPLDEKSTSKMRVSLLKVSIWRFLFWTSLHVCTLTLFLRNI